MKVWEGKGHKHIKNVHLPSEIQRNLISKIFLDRKNSNLSCINEKIFEFTSPTESDIQIGKTINQLYSIDKKIKEEAYLLAPLKANNNNYFENAKRKQSNTILSPKNDQTNKNIVTNKNLQEIIAPTKITDYKLPSLKYGLMQATIEDTSSSIFSNEYSEQSIADFSFAITPKIRNITINSEERLIESKSNLSKRKIKLLNNNISGNLLTVLKDLNSTLASSKNDDLASLVLKTSESKIGLNNDNNSHPRPKMKSFRLTKKIEFETIKKEKHPTDSFLVNNYQI